VFPGRLIGRLFLEGRVFAIAPTTNLMRADLVRARRPFYPTRYLHADIAAFLEMLPACDFGFVHDVLAFSRVPEAPPSAAAAAPRESTLRDCFAMLLEYGPRYFDAAELGRIERRHLRRCCRALLRTYLMRGGAELRRQHLAALAALGRAPRPATYGLAIAEKAWTLLAPRY